MEEADVGLDESHPGRLRVPEAVQIVAGAVGDDERLRPRVGVPSHTSIK